MDDMVQDSDLGAEAEMSPPSSPLTTGDNMDNHSVLSVSQLGNQLDTAQIVQLDRDLKTHYDSQLHYSTRGSQYLNQARCLSNSTK
jgi:hypothetical protein